jgi:hypothetical protein
LCKNLSSVDNKFWDPETGCFLCAVLLNLFFRGWWLFKRDLVNGIRYAPSVPSENDITIAIILIIISIIAIVISLLSPSSLSHSYVVLLAWDKGSITNSIDQIPLEMPAASEVFYKRFRIFCNLMIY